MKISELISQEISSYSSSFTIKGGKQFNHHETVNRVDSYMNDQYVDSVEDDDRIFWNLSNHRIIHFAKNIDLDTKNFVPTAEGETNFFQAWIARIKLLKWMAETLFAVLLNDLAESTAAYGSTLWKEVETDEGVKLQECELKNLFFDPLCKIIQDVPVVEVHYLTELQIRGKSWNNIEQILENAEKDETDDGLTQYIINERWGEFQKEGEDKPKYMHYIVAGAGNKETIAVEDEEKKENMPYRDFHIGRWKGRWLRIGIVERLFNLQVRINTLVNQNAKTTEIASLLLLKTSTAETNGNVLTDLISGDIINDSDLQQIGIDNRALAGFLREMELIEMQADKICMTPEVVQGETMPSSTTFRGMAILSNAAKSTFRFVKESIAEKVSEVLLKKILPKVVVDWNKECLVEIMDNDMDIQLYDEAIITSVKKEFLATKVAKGVYVTEQELQQLEDRVRREIETKGRKIKLGKNFFNFKFGLKFNPTGESTDKSQQNDAYFNAITLVLKNPAITNIPLFKQYLENNGISYWRLNQAQVKEIQAANMGMPAGMAPDKMKQLLSQVNSAA